MKGIVLWLLGVPVIVIIGLYVFGILYGKRGAGRSATTEIPLMTLFRGVAS